MTRLVHSNNYNIFCQIERREFNVWKKNGYRGISNITNNLCYVNLFNNFFQKFVDFYTILVVV